MDILFTPTDVPSRLPNLVWHFPGSSESWNVREIVVAGAPDAARVRRSLFVATQAAAFGEWTDETSRPDTTDMDVWGTTEAVLEAGARAYLPAAVLRGRPQKLGTIFRGLMLGAEHTDHQLPMHTMSWTDFARYAAGPALIDAMYADMSPEMPGTISPHGGYRFVYDDDFGAVVRVGEHAAA